MKRKRKRPTTEKDIDTIVSMGWQNKPVAEIVRTTGIGRSTVRRILISSKVPNIN